MHLPLKKVHSIVKGKKPMLICVVVKVGSQDYGVVA